jgi:ubiquinone/menaquinone biosynthesis C-methylase UbiE
MPDETDTDAIRSYMRTQYATYWSKKRASISSPYDGELCGLVRAVCPTPRRSLEVACGTAYPFSEYAAKIADNAFGVDLAHPLIAEAVERGSEVHCQVADAESLPFRRNVFDITFCFHSSFLFDDLEGALREMVRVTRRNGVILFDIQNRNNPSIASAHARMKSEAVGFYRWRRFIKNVVKVVTRHGFVMWRGVVHESPTDPEAVALILSTLSAMEITILARREDDGLERLETVGPWPEFARLIFVATVQ